MKISALKPLALKLGLLVLTLQMMHISNAQNVQPAPLELVPAVPITEAQAKLPRVLLIGDSISFGYAENVAKKLSDKAQVFRIKGRTASTITGTLVLNTRAGLSNVETWLQQPWDVIHFNWGLHDLVMDSKQRHAVPVEQYEANLEKLVTALEKSKAKLIWTSTTPIPEGKMSPPRLHGDEILYNEAAARVMAAHNIPTDDLYAVAEKAIQENNPNEIQLTGNVHFTPKGSQILAESVEQSILKALGN